MDARIVAAVVCTFACGHAPAPGAGPGAARPVTTIGDAATAHAAVGQEVDVRGTAAVTKLAPAVSAGDLIVYCVGLPDWPAAVAGKPVLAHGTLELTDRYAARTGPDGEHSAGTAGPVFVLRACRYKAL